MRRALAVVAIAVAALLVVGGAAFAAKGGNGGSHGKKVGSHRWEAVACTATTHKDLKACHKSLRAGGFKNYSRERDKSDGTWELQKHYRTQDKASAAVANLQTAGFTGAAVEDERAE